MAETIRCPKCNSDQIYSRVKTDDFRCRKCGNVWKNEVKKDD